MISEGDYDVSNISYDANGNIQTLTRNKGGQNGANAMDNLSYAYKPDKPNQLLRVADSAGDAANAEDIIDQNGDNYVYNDIGQLTENVSEGIQYFYNASGLVTEVRKNNQALVKFFYNDRNHRTKKESYVDGSLQATTYYVRDIAGQVMAIYNDYSGSIALAEQPIYGAGRIGVAYNSSLSGAEGKQYVYELTDHLGNVRALFSKAGNDATLEGYSDYYPFGMLMPGRNLKDANQYRYGYQGQYAKKDPETGKEAFQLRMYDSRIGRWLTTDPMGEFASPYLAMGNNPALTDPTGGMTDCPDGCDTSAVQQLQEVVVTAPNLKDVGPFRMRGLSLSFLQDITPRNPGTVPNSNPEDKFKDALQRGFPKGYWWAKLWEKYGYFEASVNTMKGAPLEVKLNKSYGLEIATDKQIPWSATYTNRSGGLVKRGVENHDKEFTIGIGAKVGASISIIDNPDGNWQIGGAVGYEVLTAEYLYGAYADNHGKQHSTFIGLDISPGFGIWYGIEGTLKLGFMIEN
ncbi:MAG: RHS repeat-associated core domain-containing protein [Bacteroidota bacterium]